VRDNPGPVNLATNDPGNLMVLSSAGPEGTVYTFVPGTSAGELTLLKRQAVKPRLVAQMVFPVNWWNKGEFKEQLDLKTMRFTTLAQLFAADVATARTREYISEDESADGEGCFNRARRTIPRVGVSGCVGYVWVREGEGVRGEFIGECSSYSKGERERDSGNLKPFAQRGGKSVAVDAKGNVYVADRQIFVYSSTG
jgi:hypothetical protein